MNVTGRMGLAQFYRQLSLLHHSGIPLEKALEICARQTSSPRVAGRALRVSEDLRHGVRMSDALSRAGAPFTALHAGVILAAENTGMYEEAFEQLATWEEKADDLERKIKSLMSYPLLVVAVATLGTAVLLRFLSPLIASAVQETGGHISLLTRAVLWVGDTVWTWQFAAGLAAMAGLAAFVAVRLWRIPSVRLGWDRFSLTVPVLGRLLRKAWMIRLARCLQSLMRAGLPMVRCIELAADATGNGYLGDRVLRDAAYGMRKGEKFSQALPASAVSRAFMGMTAVGETTGQLPSMLGRVADLHEVELSSEIESILRGLEPLVIVVVGTVVLVCLLAALQPLYALIMRL